jgi:hypothetical protein
MSEQGAKAPAARKGGENVDDTFFPGLFASWDEITQDEIAAFESALAGARDEYDMQRFLEANPRPLIQHLGGRGAWVIPKKRLGSEHETDFVIAQEASDGLVWYAVELERPQARMFNKNGDPSAALNHALRQISDWRDWLSRNSDYAARPLERSGLGLIGIDPELEGLIIIGRDAEVDQRATASRRRRLERVHRVKIETYDRLLLRASERLEVLNKRARGMPAPVGKPNAPTEWIGDIFANPPLEEPASKAVREVFEGIFRTYTQVSAVRTVDWEGIELGSDPDPDKNVGIPLKIVHARQSDRFLELHDWEDWLDHVERDLDANYSLLVTEYGPARNLQEILTLEQDGIWYAPKAARWDDDKVRYSRLDILAHLPPASSYDEKRARVAGAREVFQRYINLDRAREIEREKEAQLKVNSLSLAPGDRVEHNKFGFGIVQSTSGSGTRAEAIIDFGEEIGVKHLYLNYAPLKKPS